MITRRTLFKTIAALAATALVPPALRLAQKAKIVPIATKGPPILTEDMLNRCVARFQEKYRRTPDRILVSPHAYQDLLHETPQLKMRDRHYDPRMTGEHFTFYHEGRIRVEASARASDHFLLAHHLESDEWHPCYLEWRWSSLNPAEVNQLMLDTTRVAARRVAKAEINEFYNLKGATHA